MPIESISQMTMLDHALLYARKGWPVFPCHSIEEPGVCTCWRKADCSQAGKHPLTEHGLHDATTDEQQISEWWEATPWANIAIATGGGLFAIDIDPKNGGTLESLGELPVTAKVCTGSGGYHLLFQTLPTMKVPSSTSKLASGIDVRGDGGYIIAAPSRHRSGNRYEWLNDLEPIAPPIDLLIAVIKPDQSRTAKHTSGDEETIPEGARNDTLFRRGCTLRNVGLSQDEIEAALQAMNQNRCDPPLPEDEVARIAQSVGRYEPGEWSSLDMPPIPKRSNCTIMTLDTLMGMEIPEARWAIPHLLPEGLSILAGKPKMGKSWLALSMALSVAAGRKTLGNIMPEKGDVLYLGLEDSQRRMQERARKLLQGSQYPQGFDVALEWPSLEQGGLEGLENWLEEHPIARLVVVDTLAKVRPKSKGISNAYQEDYAVMTPLKAMADKHRVAILLIHHLRKMDASDPMDQISGSTGLTGAADAMMVLKRDRGQMDGVLHITGRDVEEQELALSFDKDTAMWSLIGEAQEYRMSRERREIIELLRQENRAMGPTEVATLLGRNASTVKKLLADMRKDGLVRALERGRYIVEGGR